VLLQFLIAQLIIHRRFKEVESIYSLCSPTYSVEDAGFVDGDHILDVNESIFTAVGLEQLKGLLD